MTIEEIKPDERVRDAVDAVIEQNAAIIEMNKVLLEVLLTPVYHIKPLSADDFIKDA